VQVDHLAASSPGCFGFVARGAAGYNGTGPRPLPFIISPRGPRRGTTMPHQDRTVHTLGHLTLALAGACLTVADFPYLPELALIFVVYLALLWLSWRSAGRRAVGNGLANLLGLLIAAAAAGWAYLRLRVPLAGTAWSEDVAIHAALVPFLGPVLMALLLVRLFQPRSPGDFWALQGIGLLQVALGCVLANGTLFAPLLLAYLAVGLCALAARERQAQRRRSAAAGGAGPAGRGGWALFALRWGAAAAALALPLFLVTPRLDGPEWRPFDRFTVRPAGAKQARTGFSDEIDLRRGGELEVDDSPAFTVRVTDADGKGVAALPADQRWRGAVLDRYEAGVWTSELAWPVSGQGHQWRPMPGGPAGLQLAFKVPGRAGGLFLADPVRLGPGPGQLPVRSLGRRVPLFFEAGGTAVAMNQITLDEYRYAQQLTPGPRDRAPAPRLRDFYLQRLLRVRPAQPLRELSNDLLRGLAAKAGERDLLAQLERPRQPWEGLPPRHWEAAGRLLCDHLAQSGEYTYSLVQEVGPGPDPTVNFLVHTKHGACERFASALALLLRAQGVPARLVKGYSGADHEGEGNYTVRQSHAHAWVEALVPARGEGPMALEWLTLDPTPDGQGLRSGQSPLARWWTVQQRTGRELWEDLIIGYNATQQATLRERLASGQLLLAALPWAGVALALLAAAALARRWRRRLAARLPGPRSLYKRLCRVLARAGVAPAADETPGELARRAEGRLAGGAATAALAGVPARVVELYYRVRYGGQEAGPDELREAAAGVERLGQALG
jgi:hypothetical protein